MVIFLFYRPSCKVMQNFLSESTNRFYNYKMQINQRSFSSFAARVLVQIVIHFQVENGKGFVFQVYANSVKLFNLIFTAHDAFNNRSFPILPQP